MGMLLDAYVVKYVHVNTLQCSHVTTKTNIHVSIYPPYEYFQNFPLSSMPKKQVLTLIYTF